MVGAVADRVQSPGPRSGTSTTSNPGARVPESAPFIALALGIDATGFTVVVVALEKLFSTDVVLNVVSVVFAITITGVVAFVVGVVVELGTSVVIGDVEEGGGDEATGALGADVEVRVKTSTSSKRGLDHISRWALFSEKGERIVFEG